MYVCVCIIDNVYDIYYVTISDGRVQFPQEPVSDTSICDL